MNTRRLQRTVILLGLLLAFGLRFYRLDEQNIWWDEGLSVVAARMSFSEATLWTAADVHPPLYFWFLWGWVRLIGQSNFAMRSITAIQAFLAVALMVPLGKRLARNTWVGVGALWLLALSRFHIWWSQEMRMYVLAGLCSMLALYFTLRLADQGMPRRGRLGWVIGTAGAMLTVYASIILVPITNLYVALVGLRRRDRWAFWGRWVLTQAWVLPLMLPWLALALPRMRSWSVVEEPQSLGFVLQLNAVLLTTGISTHIERLLLPAGLVTGVALLGAVILLTRRSAAVAQRLVLLFASIFLPALTIWALSQPRALFYNPRVEARYLLPFAPAFYLLLAWGLAALARCRVGRPLALLAGAGIVGLFVWSLPQHYAPRYMRDDYLSLVRLIWTYAEPDDGLLLVAGNRYALFDPYYDDPAAPSARPPVYALPGEGPVTAEHVARVLEGFAADTSRIWLAQVEPQMQDPEGHTVAWLEARYPRRLSFDFGHNGVRLYAPADVPVVPLRHRPPAFHLDALLAPEVTFVGYDLPAREFRPGDVLRAQLFFRADRAETVSAALVGADGLRIALETFSLEAAPQPQHRQLAFEVLPFVPAQQYRFELSAPAQPLLTLGEISIRHTTGLADRDAIPHTLEASLGDELRLLGYRLEGVGRGVPPRTRPGDVLHLTLYWVVDGPVRRPYTVFTHLMGAAHNPVTGGPLWAQDDRPSEAARHSEHTWLQGRALAESYALTVDAHAPTGDYALVVGMYDPATGQRLPVAGQGAHPMEGYIELLVLRVEP